MVIEDEKLIWELNLSEALFDAVIADPMVPGMDPEFSLVAPVVPTRSPELLFPPPPPPTEEEAWLTLWEFELEPIPLSLACLREKELGPTTPIGPESRFSLEKSRLRGMLWKKGEWNMNYYWNRVKLFLIPLNFFLWYISWPKFLVAERINSHGCMHFVNITLLKSAKIWIVPSS